MTAGDVLREYPGEDGPQSHSATAMAPPRWPWQLAGRCTAFHRQAVLPVCDSASLLAAIFLSSSGWPGVGYGVTVLTVLRLNRRQRLRICLRVSDEAAGLASAALLPVPVFLFFLNQGILIRLAAFSGSFLITMRLSLYTAIKAANRRGWLAENTLMIGAGELGTEIRNLLQDHPELGLTPVGLIDSHTLSAVSSPATLGQTHDLPELIASSDISQIIIVASEENDADIISALRAVNWKSAEVSAVPRMHELAPAIPASYQDDIWGIPLIPLRHPGPSLFSRAVKRAFDIIVGTALILVLAPLIVFLMAGVMISCGRPVLFRQTRISGSGRLIKIRKLRTVNRADLDGRWTVTAEDCSALGRWLRATHLDELPQLLNVIRGEMSLVGPRPERPYFVAKFTEIIPHYADRHRMNTGMTGWAQVNGLTGDTSIHERVRFDNNYIEHWSLWLDLIIMIRTLIQPLSGIRREHSGEKPAD
jgi:exopolysaccharide biosynthesis polyprenyl glycosylphosphotransferase